MLESEIASATEGKNNPWDPGTGLVKRRIPFDREALKLSARKAQQPLSSDGFEIVHTGFLFVFPWPLRFLRRVEPRLSRGPPSTRSLASKNDETPEARGLSRRLQF